MTQIHNTGIVSEVPTMRDPRQVAPAGASPVAPAQAGVPAGAPEAPERGVFVTFEGGDGAGKTTHIRFLANALSGMGREVVCLREPGGTDVGEQLRGVVLSPKNVNMCDASELLIYEAARAQLVSEVIVPALSRGAVVLCDRFTDSTVAYQGYGRGLDRAFVDAANAFACQGLVPDRTILLVSGGSTADGLARATRRAGADRMERAGEDFHARVNAAFLDIARRDPKRVRLVQSSGRKSHTAVQVFAQLADLFPWMGEFVRQNEAYFERLDVQRAHEGRVDYRDDARPAPAPAAPKEQ